MALPPFGRRKWWLRRPEDNRRLAADRRLAETPEDGDRRPERFERKVGQTGSMDLDGTNSLSGSPNHDVKLAAVFRSFDEPMPGGGAELNKVGGGGRIRGDHSQLCTCAHISELLVGAQHRQWAKQPARIQLIEVFIRHLVAPPAKLVSTARYARITRKLD